MTGAMSVFEYDEPWLVSSLAALIEASDLSWTEFRNQLCGIMWIDAIHAERARQIFRHVTQRTEISILDR
jgi:hypothetical protein